MKNFSDQSKAFLHRHNVPFIPGEEYDNDIFITIDPSLFLLWSCFIPSIRQADSNKLFWEDLGYASPLIPYTFMYNLSLSLAVFGFTEYTLKHISIEDVVYLRPTYAGDTLKVRVIIISVEKRQDGNYEIRSLHSLINQKEKVVFQLIKTSLFPSNTPIKEGRVNVVNQIERYSNLASHILSGSTNSSYIPYPRFQLEEGHFYAHEMVRPMAHCENTFFSTMLKNMHPSIINPLYHHGDTYIPEGHIVGIIQGITSTELSEYLCPEIEKATQLATMNANSTLGAFSYIMGKEKSDFEFEELYIRTFGLKDYNPLSSLEPDELSSALGGQINSQKDLVKILGSSQDALADHICLIMDWKIYRLTNKKTSSFII